MGSGGFQHRVLIRDPIGEGGVAFVRRVPYHDDLVQRAVIGQNWLDRVKQVFVHNQYRHTRVAEDVVIFLGLQQRVHAQGDAADLSRGKKRRHPFGAVGTKDRHAIAKPDPGAKQRIASLVDLIGHLAKRQQGGVAENSRLVRVICQVVFKNRADVVVKRKVSGPHHDPVLS